MLTALAGCEGGPSGSAASDEWADISEADAVIQARLPGISGAGRRQRKSRGHENFIESATWGRVTSPPSAELLLFYTSPTGRRFFTRSGDNTLADFVRRRHSGISPEIGAVRTQPHHIGEVEHLRYSSGTYLHCLALRAYDGALPEEGFAGTASINDSLGKTILYALYCVRNASDLSDETVREVIGGIGIKRFAPIP